MATTAAPANAKLGANLMANTSNQRGTTLLETLVATAICTVVVFGLAGLITTATRNSKNQGTSTAQTSTLAAQKLDELLGKSFTCAPLPSCSISGSGASADGALTAGGSVTSNSTGYYDLLDNTGAPVGAGVTPFFTRRWLIEDVTTTTKRITVRVEGQAIGNAGPASAPSTTLACIKAMQ